MIVRLAYISLASLELVPWPCELSHQDRVPGSTSTIVSPSSASGALDFRCFAQKVMTVLISSSPLIIECALFLILTKLTSLPAYGQSHRFSGKCTNEKHSNKVASNSSLKARRTSYCSDVFSVNPAAKSNIITISAKLALAMLYSADWHDIIFAAMRDEDSRALTAFPLGSCLL